MRWEQLAACLIYALLSVSPSFPPGPRGAPIDLLHRSPKHCALSNMSAPPVGDVPAAPGARVSGQDHDASQTPQRSPLADIRRIAVILPVPSMDPEVQRVVAIERAMHSRRRPSLLSPKLQDAPGSSNEKKKPKFGVAPRNPGGKGGQITPQIGSPAVPSMTNMRMRAIAEALFGDTFLSRLSGRMNLQIVPQSETLEAMKALDLSSAGPREAESVDGLCRRLQCDAIIMPKVSRLRTQEAGMRMVSVWINVQMLRPAASGVLTSPSAGASRFMANFPAAGGAVSERVPFQDRFTKEWPQLASEAAKQAAGVAAHTLATGVAAPFVREGERVALVPVVSPTQADALIFHTGGRTVDPASLRNLPADVSQFFHPYLVPLFPESIVSSKEAGLALAAHKSRVEALWTRTEAPDSAQVMSLGKRLNVQYVLLARVWDIETAVNATVPAPGELPGSVGASAQDPAVAQESSTDTASAEAIGALVRVSDGAVLWRDRTTATTAERVDMQDPGTSRKRLALDAVRFSLLQLERRFRQYRLRFE